MAVEQAQILRPETLVNEFEKNGVTHVITIPDSETNHLYDLMAQQDWLDIIPVSREGETMGIALGLNAAGKVPVLSHPEHRDAGVRRFDSWDGPGRRLSARAGRRLQRVDAPRRHLR